MKKLLNKKDVSDLLSRYEENTKGWKEVLPRVLGRVTHAKDRDSVEAWFRYGGRDYQSVSLMVDGECVDSFTLAEYKTVRRSIDDIGFDIKEYNMSHMSINLYYN